MPKRSSKKTQGPTDTNTLAFNIVARATGEKDEDEKDDDGKNPAAVALGRLGGLKGGRARAKSLSKKKRTEIAKRAARARWGTNKPPK